MPRASLSVQIPENAWVSTVSRAYPDATFRVVSAFVADDHGIGIVEIETDGDLDEIVDEIRGHDVIADMEVLWSEGNKAVIRFRTREPMMLLAARESRIPVRMPFEIQDGVGKWTLTAPRESLSELSTVFNRMGIDYEVDYIHEIRPENLLTDKQEDVMTKALDMGFYDTPRDASLSDVADELGIAKSTCSEILHRAEEKIVKDFFG